MLASKPDWVPLELGKTDRQFPQYPDESIAAWHDRLGLTDLGLIENDDGRP